MNKKELLEAYNKLLEEKLEREREANKDFMDFSYDQETKEMRMIVYKKWNPKDWKIYVFTYWWIDTYWNLIFQDKWEMITPVYNNIENSNESCRTD